MTDPGFALYVHWPFCKAKCPYCDFNSHVRPEIDQTRWRAALLAELDRIAADSPNRPLASIFFGGGTPSLMPPETVAAIIERAGRHWRFAPDIEITLEANPTSFEAEKFRHFQEAGVNRVSLGVQALYDEALRFLGREHTAKEALDAAEEAARIFERFSIDLIYARPDQTAEAWAAELDHALALGTRHLSLYQLTIEPGTRFHALHRMGALPTLDDASEARLFELTQTRLDAHGLPAYEISNHAAPGEESRHNLVYWRSGDWAGIGPGAHGRLTLDGTRYATETERTPERWLTAVETHGHAEHPRTPLTALDQLTEFLVMGLRLTEGVSVSRLHTLEQAAATPLDWPAIHRLENQGLLTRTPTHLKATPEVRLRLNAILERILS